MAFNKLTMVCAWLLAVFPAIVAPAHAQKLSLIRDSEIEMILREWANPLFDAAGLDRSAVRILIVNDQRLNAFVAGGQNLFLNTGLLMSSDDPDQVIGVIAHETGHIAGGHLARTGDALENAQNLSLLHTLLGLGILAAGAAAGASGTTEVGGALIAGGQLTGVRSFLQYTRAQENAADQAALTYLDRSGRTARGLLTFLDKLIDQELLVADRQDPYLRTHPLTRDRIEVIAAHTETSEWTDSIADARVRDQHARMRAKLKGYLDRPQRVMRAYPAGDQSLYGRYARAIALHRRSDMSGALAEIDSLLAERPEDPFFHEMKGQILLENGRANDAMAAYEAANRLRPDDPLLLTGLAQAQLESGDPAVTAPAIESLQRATRLDQANSTSWRLLAVAHGRTGDVGASSLAAGEQALLEGRPKDAVLHARRADRTYAEGSPEWLRAQDILELAERQIDNLNK